MSDISTIRTLIGDQIQYGTSESEADGTVVDFLLPYAPIYPGSTKVYVAGTQKTVDIDYAVDEDLGLITFLTAPNATVTITAKYTLLSDAQITEIMDLLSVEWPDRTQFIRLTAADCLDIIASNEAMIQKKMRLLDMDTDGPAIAKSLREHAKALREQVRLADKQDESDFDIIEMVYDEDSFLEKIVKDLEREG